jgi:cob(I)alamin adenosyltransferase
LKLYTRTGDAGTTALFGGGRVSKAHPRVEAYGAVDELNAVLGVAAAALGEGRWREEIEAVQARLFDLGADLAAPPGSAAAAHVPRAAEEWVSALERDIDRFTEAVPPLRTFVLPGGHPAAAALQLARTVCRRAERRVVAAGEAGEEIEPVAGRYLNRLSDWLFAAARLVNEQAGVAEIRWQPAAADVEEGRA